MKNRNYQDWIETFQGISQGGVDDDDAGATPALEDDLEYSYQPEPDGQADDTQDDAALEADPDADDDLGEPDLGEPDLDDDATVEPPPTDREQQMLDLLKQQQDYIAELQKTSAKPETEGAKPQDYAEVFRARGIQDDETLKLLSAAAEEAEARAYDRVMRDLGPAVGYTMQTAQDRQAMEGMVSEYGLSEADQREIVKHVNEARKNGSRATTEELHFMALGRVRAKKQPDASKLAAARKKKRDAARRVTTEPTNRQTKLVPDKMPDEQYDKLSWSEKIEYFRSLNKKG